MFGFIKSLFGSRDAANIDNSMVPQRSKDAYFLDQDAASTLGDVNYMRSTKSIKRTYAKSVDSPDEKATIKQVSAMNSKVYEASESAAKSTFVTPSASSQSNFSTPAPTPPRSADAASERIKTDTSMDMFRNMAKDLRK
jgi:hypothetical protein